jgi:hypothetical protein
VIFSRALRAVPAAPEPGRGDAAIAALVEALRAGAGDASARAYDRWH